MDGGLISQTDRSIFEEFDERQTSSERVENVRSIPERIAKLTAQGIDDESLLKMFDLSIRELADIRKLENYSEGYSRAVSEEVERPLEIDDSWDDIEARALRVARDNLDFLGAEEALTMALRANRAQRRTKDTVKDTSTSVSIQTVNLAVPVQLMNVLSEMNVTAELRKTIDANTQNKIVDLARPQRIDELMVEKSREEEIDNNIMEHFE